MLFHGFLYDGSKVIDDLQVFVNENTKFDQLSIDDYLAYFAFFSLIHLFLSLSFLIHYLSFKFIQFFIDLNLDN